MPITAPDAAAPIVKKLFSTQEEVVDALSNNYFYLELMLVGIAFALAGLVGYAIRYRLNLYLKGNPEVKLDKEFITKPVSLFPPLLSLVLLGVVKPLSIEYSNSSVLADAAVQLCVYYIAAKIVLLVVRSRPVAWFIAFVIMAVAVLDISGFMKVTTAFLAAMSFSVGSFKIPVLNLINGIIIFVIVLWGAGVLSRTLESYLRRSSSLNYSSRELMVKFFKIFIYFIAFLITLSVAGVDLTAFAVFGGALGVGIGLGLQKVTANFLSGITLLLERSIKIGDLIDVGNVSGWVRQLNIRYALVEAFDGREILIPNEELLTTRVTNWTYSNNNARIEIPVGVAYGSDVRLAQRLMVEAARAHPSCMREPEPNCFMTHFADSSINFLLVFWVSDVRDGKMAPQSEVMFKILEKFKEHNIEIPFPQRVVHLNKEEKI